MTDYFAHETVSNLPVIGSVVDSILNLWNSFTSYFTGTTNTTINSSNNLSQQANIPEVFSLAFSGDFDITIRYFCTQTITPPVTRAATPIPNFEDYSNG